MKIYHQSVFDRWPMEDGSMQAIICSPPYWGLRKYDIPDIEIKGCDCLSWKGQYGLESSYKDYIEHTRLWAKEAWRVLRDDGVFFLNIGDSYGGSGGGHKEYHNNNSGFQGKRGHLTGGQGNSARAKCKLLIPHRIAIALIDDGWILRNDLVWHKPNGMPESCQDRFSKKFEYIFMLVKNEKYYFDLDAIRGNYNPNTLQRNKYQYKDRTGKDLGQLKGKDNTYKSIKANELGKNPGDIWQINTQPSSEKHFAMWPEKLVERMLLCSTRPGDSILDCFAGSGTTLRVAEQHNRVGFGIDLGYQDIQRKRLDNIQKKLL